jgi:hypothetical protein
VEVKYAITLSECQGYKITETQFLESLSFNEFSSWKTED